MILNYVTVITITYFVSQVTSLSCLDAKKSYEKSCLESDQDNYVQCVRTRMKRQQHECEYNDDCYECDCESCSYSDCGGQCDECCNSCCSSYVQCHTNHCCHKQCHSECRSYNCRISCRKACYETVERERQVERVTNEGRIERLFQVGGASGDNSANQKSKANNSNVHNITTIINLKNVLNNTNFVDVPINLTYTNKNNISLHEAEHLLRNGGSGATGDNCCVVIGPRQCIPIQVSPYTRCFHTRSRQCGTFCSATIVHEENTQMCSSVDSLGRPTNCQQQTSYIPQPQPRCTYTSTWPYVACGIQSPTACEGCYGSYLNSQVKQSCPPQCYDDFNAGPLYRQGPFYQPGYPQVPPCAYSPQGCAGYGFGGGMNGLGQMPGIGGYGQFPSGYGYGLNPGFAAGPFPWIDPNFGNGLNTTRLWLNTSGLTQPQIPDRYEGNINIMPLSQVPEKEVELDVAITGPDSNRFGQPYKRGLKRSHKKKERVSVVKV